MCYSDIPYLYTGRGFAEGQWPYADSDGRYEVMEYPVGISYLAWVAAKVTQLDPVGPPDRAARSHVDAGAAVVAARDGDGGQPLLPGDRAAAVRSSGCSRPGSWPGCIRGRPWDALPFVLSPALLRHRPDQLGPDGGRAASRAPCGRGRADRPVLAGVLIGLGAATKLYPLFLLGPDPGRSPGGERRLGAFGVGRARCRGAPGWWSTCPAWLTGCEQWKVFWTLQRRPGRRPRARCGWSLPHAGHAFTPDDDQPVVLGAVRRGLRRGRRARAARRRGRRGWPSSAFLVVAGFLLVNKVYSPQYVLWLLPLAVLARPRWRDLLIWQAGELVYLAGGLDLPRRLARGVPPGGGSPVYDLAIWVRVAAELYLVAVVVRDVLRPEHDPVAVDGSAGAIGPTPSAPSAGQLISTGRRWSR